jgi:hypothetical protein
LVSMRIKHWRHVWKVTQLIFPRSLSKATFECVHLFDMHPFGKGTYRTESTGKRARYSVPKRLPLKSTPPFTENPLPPRLPSSNFLCRFQRKPLSP